MTFADYDMGWRTGSKARLSVRTDTEVVGLAVGLGVSSRVESAFKINRRSNEPSPNRPTKLTRHSLVYCSSQMPSPAVNVSFQT